MLEVEEPIDIAKVYEQRSRKPMWILKDVTRKIWGRPVCPTRRGVFRKSKSTQEKNMPHTTFSPVDRQIYYLSRVVDEDLFPWFEEIGTTIHPLPLLPNDSDEFVAAVRGIPQQR